MRPDTTIDKREVSERLTEIATNRVFDENLHGRTALLEQECSTHNQKRGVTDEFKRLFDRIVFKAIRSTRVWWSDVPRSETEKRVSNLVIQTQARRKLGCAQRVNRRNATSPIIVTTESRPHAQKAFTKIQRIPYLVVNSSDKVPRLRCDFI